MHIPDSMLQGNVCPVTAAISVAGIAGAAYFAVKSEKKPTAARFGAVAALIFAGQMMNFPIAEGTSGHLLGGVLAAALLGTPFGVLAIAAVVAIQSLVFADGGVSVLGANLLNMSVIGAGLGGIIYSYLKSHIRHTATRHITAGLVAWLSVVLASVAVSIELAADNSAEFSTVFGAMVLTHAIIGIGEGFITTVACFLFASDKSKNSPAMRVAAPLGAAGLIGLICSPFASSSPDGLEWVATRHNFLNEGAPLLSGILPDYSVPGLASEALSTGSAGIIGVAITFAFCYAAALLINRPQPETAKV